MQKYIRLLICLLILPFLFGFNGYYRLNLFWSNPFSGTLTAANTDTTFSEITTGDSHELSEITDADPGVITFAGGAEKITNGTFDTVTTGWTSGSGANLTIAGGELVVTLGGGDSFGNAYQALTLIPGWYVFSGELISESGSAQVKIDRTSTSSDLVSLGTEIVGTFERFVEITVSGTYYIQLKTNGVGSNAVFDDISVKLLHDYTAGDVISIGGVESGALGADLGDDCSSDNTADWTTQTDCVLNFDTDHYEIEYSAATQWIGKPTSYTAGVYYKAKFKVKDGTSAGVSLWFSDEDQGGKFLTEYTTSATWVEYTVHFKADGDSESIAFNITLPSGNIEIKDITLEPIVPILAKPYRIDSVSATGVVTLLNADFSDLAAAITSGFTTSASLTNYTEGDGWMPGLDLDPTPVNSGTLTIGTVYFINELGTPDTFYTNDALGDFFTSDGTENPDATNVVMALTDTYAVCDGEQTGTTELTSDEFTVTQNTGMKYTSNGTITAGEVTPFAGTRDGDEITTLATENNQNIKAQGTGGNAGYRGSTAFIGTLTEAEIQTYE